jgi:hypothetical protein
MRQSSESAERLVFRAISVVSPESTRSSQRAPEAQDLPTIDLLGAAIARAARLAAANDRARMPDLRLANTQAAGLLNASRREMDALFTDLNNDEGELLPPINATPSYVWRFHAAPMDDVAPAGACIACDGHTATLGAIE